MENNQQFLQIDAFWLWFVYGNWIISQLSGADNWLIIGIESLWAIFCSDCEVAFDLADVSCLVARWKYPYSLPRSCNMFLEMLSFLWWLPDLLLSINHCCFFESFILFYAFVDLSIWFLIATNDSSISLEPMESPSIKGLHSSTQPLSPSKDIS